MQRTGGNRTAVLFAAALILCVSAVGQVVAPLEVIPASKVFSLTEGSSSIRYGEARVYAGTTDRVSGYAEFDVPRSATNLQVTLTFGGSWSQRMELFAYPAGSTNGTMIPELPREFIGALTTNLVQEFDVTPFMSKYAGSRLGVALPLRQIPGSGGGTFTNFALRLYSMGAIDAGPRIRLLDYVPPILPTNSLTLRAEIIDADSVVTNVQLLDDKKILPTKALAQPLLIGANPVEFTLTNLAVGKHYYSVTAKSLAKVASSELKPVVVTTNAVPIHRWLGSKADSAAFYVVDAAGRAQVWGYGASGPGVPAELKRPFTLFPPQGSRFLQIASTFEQTIAFLDDGSLYYLAGSSPRRINTPNGVSYFRALRVSSNISVAVDQDGRFWTLSPVGAIYLYPAGSLTAFREVQTANGSYIASANKFPTLPAPALPLIDFSAEGLVTYAIGADHKLYSWNVNVSPVTVTETTLEDGTGFQRVAACENATLLVDDVGRLWSWKPTTFPALVPMPANETNWLDITITTHIAMALSANGNLYACGDAVFPSVWKDPRATIAKVPELVSGLPDLLDPNATETTAPMLVPPLARLTTNGLRLQIVAPTGLNTIIQASSDFINWTDYTNFPAQPYLTTATLGIEGTNAKFFRIQ